MTGGKNSTNVMNDIRTSRRWPFTFSSTFLLADVVTFFDVLPLRFHSDVLTFMFKFRLNCFTLVTF